MPLECRSSFVFETTDDSLVTKIQNQLQTSEDWFQRAGGSSTIARRFGSSRQQSSQQRDAIDHRGTSRSRSYYKLTRVSIKCVSRVMSVRKNILFVLCVLRVESWKRNLTKKEKLAPRETSTRREIARSGEKKFSRRRVIVRGYNDLWQIINIESNAQILELQQRPSQCWASTRGRTTQEQERKRDGWCYRWDNSREWKMFEKFASEYRERVLQHRCAKNL